MDPPHVAPHLKWSTLQQVNPVFAGVNEVDRKFDIYRVFIRALQRTEHASHVLNESGLREQPVEGDDAGEHALQAALAHILRERLIGGSKDTQGELWSTLHHLFESLRR